jgi:hypothetical protein
VNWFQYSTTVQTRPYYNTKKWDEDNFHHDIQMGKTGSGDGFDGGSDNVTNNGINSCLSPGYMCKYPRVLPPMYRPAASQKSFESIGGGLGAPSAASPGTPPFQFYSLISL